MKYILKFAIFISIHFISNVGICQYASNVPLSATGVVLPQNFKGTWNIIDTSSGFNENKLQDFIVIRALQGNNFLFQEFTTSSSEDELKYSTVNYYGFLSKIDNVYFLNLRSLSKSDMNEEDEISEEFFSKERKYYSIYRIDFSKSSFSIKSVDDFNIKFSSSSEMAEFFKKNMNKSYFYYNGYFGNYDGKIMIKD